MKCKIKECKTEYKTRISFTAKEDDEIIIFHKYGHNHSGEELKNLAHYGVKEKIKQLIDPMIANKVKPTRITKILEEYVKQGAVKEDDLPSTDQIQTLRRNGKKKESTLETRADFSLLMESFSIKENTSENDTIIIGQNLNPDDFCLVFSSRQLLKNVIGQASSCSTQYLCLDATYKLTVVGYPLLVFGTQNINHKFRLIGFALSRHEREKDFTFALSSIKYALQEFYKYEWRVDFIMADGSHAIRNATKAIFGDKYQHGMCSVHVKRNIEKRITSCVDVEHRSDLRDDFDFLKIIHDSGLFKVAISLFEKKWNSITPEFVDYFLQTWVYSEFCNWYAGSIPIGFSTTNNGIEGFNYAIKNKYTDWDRYKLNEFVGVLKGIIEDNSKEELENSFPTSFTLDQNLWRKVLDIKKDPFKQTDQITFYWSQLKINGKRAEIYEKDIQKYNNAKRLKSFKPFKESLKLWKVVIGDNISTTVCSCPKFRLINNCKHVVSALLKLELIQIPNEYSDEIIVESKKTVGRTKKATPALIREIND